MLWNLARVRLAALARKIWIVGSRSTRALAASVTYKTLSGRKPNPCQWSQLQEHWSLVEHSFCDLGGKTILHDSNCLNRSLLTRWTSRRQTVPLTDPHLDR